MCNGRTIVLLVLLGSASLARADQGSTAIRQKLTRIVLPSVEFRSTTLADAVEFVRQESRRLDPDPAVEARGVNILVKLPGGAATPPRITLALTRIPLLEALRYIAAQAGLKVKVEEYAVSLAPPGENTDPMVTAVFRVPPNFLGNSADAPRPGN